MAAAAFVWLCEQSTHALGLSLSANPATMAKIMIKFSGTASGEVQMLDAHAKHLLALIGKDASTQGVISPQEMDLAIQRLSAAGREDVLQAQREQAEAQQENDDEDELPPERVGLTQRAFPLIEMLKRAQAAGEPVLWGL